MSTKMPMTPDHMARQCGMATDGPGDKTAKKQAGMTKQAPRWDQDKAERSDSSKKED